MLSEEDRSEYNDAAAKSSAKTRVTRLLGDKPVGTMSVVEARALIRELRIYQAELEIQNEELRRAQHEIEEARDRFRDLYDFSPVGYLTVAKDGRITEANLTAARMLRLPRPVLVGSRFFRWVAKEDREAYIAHRNQVQETGVLQSAELRLTVEDGSDLDVRLESIAIGAAAGGSTGFRVAMTDVSARKQAERRWQLADAVLEEASEGIVIINRERRISRANSAFSEITGYAWENLRDRDFRRLAAGRGDTEALDMAWSAVQSGAKWSGELQFRNCYGGTLPARVSLTPIRDGDGGTCDVAVTLVDMTELKRSEEQLRYRAQYDSVTGLPNRLLLADRIAEGAKEARRHGTLMGYLLIDLDRFKQVNDELGHDAGDMLLREVARRLSGCIRGHDTVARLGGDEFAVVLTDVREEQSVATVAEKIGEALSAPCQIEGAEVWCTGSIGIAVYPGDASAFDELQRYADMAMYRAKGEGRSTYRFFDASMSEHVQARLRTRTDISRGLRSGEFHLVYQPIYRTATASVAGAEALLRWRHPERGLLTPDQFLDVAEETGLIRSLGGWAMKEACRQAAVWGTEAADRDLFVSVNVSAPQLTSPEARSRLLASLDECRLPQGRFALEITESIPVKSTGAMDALRALQHRGVRLIMDDFGTGYSSLGLLTRLPFDMVKIDRFFVEGVESDPTAAHLVDTIIYMAHGLGLKVIAEGVESEGQLAFLRERGCDFVQGNLVSPTLKPEDLQGLL